MRLRLLACLVVLVAVTASCGTTEDAPGAADPELPGGEQPDPRWELVEAEGPPARTDHALAAAGGDIYLFGGRSNRQELGDLWRLELPTGEWAEVQVEGESPAPRFGPAFEARPDGTLILFGGERRSTGTFFDDVWSFDPSSNAWTMLPGGGGPAARYGAGSAVDPGGTLYVTHGFTGEGRFDDTWSFEGGEFTDRSGEGGRPIARCLLHAAYHDGGLLVFGGQSNPDPFLNDLWRLDLDAGTWRRIDPEQRPSERNLYAAAQNGSGWWIHGGRGPDGPLDDLWLLDMSTELFEVVSVEGGPSARSGHAAAALTDGLVVFGGAGTEGELADTWRLVL